MTLTEQIKAELSNGRMGIEEMISERELLLRVIEKLVGQRSEWVEAFNNGDDYIKEVGTWKIIQRENEEILSVLKHHAEKK